jgi:GxxExxY protein
MPIIPSIPTTRILQIEFKELARKVMGHVFDIHNEFGRLLDELAYKRELAGRLPGVLLEVPVTVTHDSFAKSYFLDALVGGSGLFEFKAVDALHSRHRGQALNYLLLFDLGHGKIINVRTPRVEHAFVNCTIRLSELRNPRVVDRGWRPDIDGAAAFHDIVMALVRDWGAGLEFALYEEALTHLLGGEQIVFQRVPIFGRAGHLADQSMRLVAPGVAFRITAFPNDTDGLKQIEDFEAHSRKLLDHTVLTAMHWANIAPHRITFTTLQAFRSAPKPA